MEQVWEIAVLILFSATKFFLAPPAAVLAGYNYWQSVLICGIGGSFGFVFFFFTASWLVRLWSRLRKKKAKLFSRKNKLIVKTRASFGLLGIALLTPCLLSIPLGGILAANYYRKNKLTIPIFITFVWLWAFVLTYVTLFIKFT